jgi:hypothetical protein
MKQPKRRNKRQKAPTSDGLPPPPVPPDADLRDVPIPISAFIELAMSQFGMGRDEATKLVLGAVAQRYGAKGNA